MNSKNLFTVLLLTAALVLSACNKTNDPPVSGDSDTDAQTPVITDTAADTPAAPVVTDAQTEPMTEPLPTETETVEIPVVTEPAPETTEPLPELPVEIPAEDTAAPTTETTVPAETEAPAPIVIVKPTVDLAGKLIPGGDAVSGQVKSTQSENICLLLDYTAEQAEDGSITLTLDVGLSCYELWCSAKTDMGSITVNGVSRTFSTDAIDHMVHEKTYIPFLSQTYNATGNQSASVEVSWYFNGTYGGTEIGMLSTGLILLFDGEGTVITPPTTEPVTTDPVTTESVGTEPVTTDPVGTEPIPAETEPTYAPIPPNDETQPSQTEPVPTNPVVTDPVVTTDPADPTTPVEPTDPNAPADTDAQTTADGTPVVEYVIPPEEAGTP